MNTNQIICLVITILLVLILLGIFLIPQKKEKYVSEEVDKLNTLLNFYPEILTPTNSIFFMKLLDVLTDLSKKSRLNLDRSQIRGILINLINRKITDFVSGNIKTLFLELLLDYNIVESIRKDLKYKITSSLKSIIDEFIIIGVSMGLDTEEIFNRLTNSIKSEIPLDINSSQITTLLKLIYNSRDLRQTSMVLPENDEFKKMYIILDNPKFRENILNRFIILINSDEESAE